MVAAVPFHHPAHHLALHLPGAGDRPLQVGPTGQLPAQLGEPGLGGHQHLDGGQEGVHGIVGGQMGWPDETASLIEGEQRLVAVGGPHDGCLIRPGEDQSAAALLHHSLQAAGRGHRCHHYPLSPGSQDQQGQEAGGLLVADDAPPVVHQGEPLGGGVQPSPKQGRDRPGDGRGLLQLLAAVPGLGPHRLLLLKTGAQVDRLHVGLAEETGQDHRGAAEAEVDQHPGMSPLDRVQVELRDGVLDVPGQSALSLGDFDDLAWENSAEVLAKERVLQPSLLAPV